MWWHIVLGDYNVAFKLRVVTDPTEYNVVVAFHGAIQDHKVTTDSIIDEVSAPVSTASLYGVVYNLIWLSLFYKMAISSQPTDEKQKR